MLSGDDEAACRVVFSRYNIGNKMLNTRLFYGYTFLADDRINVIYVPKNLEKLNNYDGVLLHEAGHIYDRPIIKYLLLLFCTVSVALLVGFNFNSSYNLIMFFSIVASIGYLIRYRSEVMADRFAIQKMKAAKNIAALRSFYDFFTKHFERCNKLKKTSLARRIKVSARLFIYAHPRSDRRASRVKKALQEIGEQ